MKLKLLLTGFLCLFFSHVHAQINDDFNDSDLLVNPVWSGQTTFFTTSGGWLKSNNPNLNTGYYIALPCYTSAGSEWFADVKLLFNTSSLNYVDLVLLSDSGDVTKMKNGYYVRLGGTTDEISLFRTQNGTDVKIIDGADNVLNTSNNQWHIHVMRLGKDSFVLERKLLTGGVMLTEGFAIDSNVLSGRYFGIRIKQSTASFVGKHYLDNLYAGRIIKDTTAPVCDSAMLLNSRQIALFFNEPTDSISLLKEANYKISETMQQPDSVKFISRSKAVLAFNGAFLPNRVQHLIVSDVYDKAGNMMMADTFEFYYSKPDTAAWRELLITEIMADPDPVAGLPLKEYVEVYNHSGNKFIQLAGCQLHDATGYIVLPVVILPPDSFIVLYNVPSLNNSGDRLSVTNQKGELLHSVNYDYNWYGDAKKADGGYSLEMINTAISCTGKSNWHASMHPSGGTPGRANSIMPVADIQGPEIKQFSFINDSTVLILCTEEIDSALSISAKVTIDGLPVTFAFKSYTADHTGVQLMLRFSADKEKIHTISITGLQDCSGNSNKSTLFQRQWPSISARGELIFNEVLFNPKTGGYDFLEVYNNSKKVFDMSRHFMAVMDERGQYKSITRLTDSNILLNPGQFMVFSENCDVVCSHYDCKDSNAVFLNFKAMPSLPDDAGSAVIINVNGQVADSLYYLKAWHLSLLSDQNGVSLERISYTAPTSVIDNWHSAASTAGYATPGYENSQSIRTGKSPNYFALQSKTVSPDEDGYEDLLIVNYNLPMPGYMVSISIYDTEGRLVRELVNNRSVSTEGFLTWDGTDDNGQKTNTGIYILMIEGFTAAGKPFREKTSCVVATKF